MTSAIYIPALLFAVGFIALDRWWSEHRAARWQKTLDSRMSGNWAVEPGDGDVLAAPYLKRVIIPQLEGFRRRLALRITPTNFHDELAEKLQLAGIKQSAEVFFFTRLASSLVVLLISGLAALSLSNLSQDERVLGPIVLTLVVYLYPSVHLNTRAQARLAEIDRELPEVFDLLSVSVEAGLAFDGALRKVVSNLDGPAREEFSRVLADMQLGIPRAGALTSLARRTRSAPLRRFAGLVTQSDRTGGGLGAALKVQARDIKEYRAARAREKAATIPIKIIIPMVVFIFPAMFVIILGPALISVLKTFHP